MKVVILAGGKGSRLDSTTETIPKPLVRITKLPILIHIIKIFIRFGHNDFIIALGYKGEKILNYFYKGKITHKIRNKLNKGFTVERKFLGKKCNITLLNTGQNTMTGGRLKRAAKLINDESFFLTYGDGVANINLNKLLAQHKRYKKLVTLTAVNPPSKFGELKINQKKITSFQEKQKYEKKSWINGGFFVVQKEFIKHIKNDKTVLEKEPLETIAKNGQLYAYKHEGFWHCMDTKKDKESLEKIFKKKNILLP